MLNETQSTLIARPQDFVAHHQLSAYFILTLVISWTVWFLIPRSNGLSTIGGIGPFFSAVIVTALLPSDKTDGYLWRRIVCFCATYVVTMLIWLGGALIPTAPRYHVLTGVAAAVIFAFAFSGFYSNRRNVRELLASLAQWRVGWLPWVAVFFLAPMLILFGVFIDLVLSGPFPSWPVGTPSLTVFAAAFGTICFGVVEWKRSVGAASHYLGCKNDIHP